MSRLLILGATVITPEAVRPHTPVLVENGRIVQVGGPVTSSGAEVIDAGGQYLLPGFIDLQVNGYAGADFMDGDPAAVQTVSQALVAHGVTGYLPTLITAMPDRMLRAVKAVHAGSSGVRGAVPLGLHIEGPFISVSKRGSHPVDAVRPFEPVEWAAWWLESAGTVRMLTLAPEQGENWKHVAALRKLGVAVAIGHSDASYEEAERAAVLGANCVTHCYNGMRGLHHRDPGVVGALMALPELVGGVIADGYHIHPAAVRALYRAKGPDELYLVTDVVPVAGLPAGTYEWVGGPVQTDGETVRLVRDGGLAGAALSMDRAVINMMKFTGASLREVSIMASLTPARLIGLHDRGAIVPGMRADMVLLNQRLQVAMTLIAGEAVYRP